MEKSKQQTFFEVSLVDILEKAAKSILNGNLVVMPTETVYGLAADATNESACQKIYELKERPRNNPLIVHVSCFKQAEEVALFNNDAHKLTSMWPGPLTMVLPRNKKLAIADCVTAGLSTVAIRIPAYEIALRLLRLCNRPLAAPSANISGRLSPTSYAHVRKNFGENNELIILPAKLRINTGSSQGSGDNQGSDGNNLGDSIYLEDGIYHEGACLRGIESTIIDLTTDEPTILRHGSITSDLIEMTLGKRVLFATNNSELKSPGMLHKHYAPRATLRLDSTDIQDDEIGLEFGANSLHNPNSAHTLNLSERGDLFEAAANLFAMLYALDEYAKDNDVAGIAVAAIPDESIGLTINDRLRRGAVK